MRKILIEVVHRFQFWLRNARKQKMTVSPHETTAPRHAHMHRKKKEQKKETKIEQFRIQIPGRKNNLDWLNHRSLSLKGSMIGCRRHVFLARNSNIINEYGSTELRQIQQKGRKFLHIFHTKTLQTKWLMHNASQHYTTRHDTARHVVA